MKTERIKYNAVLKTKKEYIRALDQIDKLDLPRHGDLPKNWDSLAALSIINYEYETNGLGPKDQFRILDAGGEYYSVILHQLATSGFKELYCINISFNESSRIGNIEYYPGDITKSDFKDHVFDFVTCLSVIEHGVDINLFFKEMSRIIKTNGVLIVSTDYWETETDNQNKVAYGVPIKIFSKQDILSLIEIAKQNGMELIDQIDVEAQDRVINWEGLKYTFIYLSFRKFQ